MRQYVAFLNMLHERNLVDLDKIEDWWIDRVKEYFEGKPFILHYDQSKSFRIIFNDLLSQAEQRQAQSPGSTIVGKMLQHLVGAKLNLFLEKPVASYGASVADKATNKEGDFIIEDVVIHVTTAPSESLIAKCQRNIDSGFRPIIITLENKINVAKELAKQYTIENRIDFFDVEQFLVGNIYEISKFSPLSRKTTAIQLINEYNKIIKECETDPSLYIVIANGG